MTGDALRCQGGTARLIHERGGAWLFALKAVMNRHLTPDPERRHDAFFDSCAVAQAPRSEIPAMPNHFEAPENKALVQASVNR